MICSYRERGAALVAGEQVFLHMEMGWALAQRGVYHEALRSYKQALEMDPDNAIGWFRCGWRAGAPSEGRACSSAPACIQGTCTFHATSTRRAEAAAEPPAQAALSADTSPRPVLRRQPSPVPPPSHRLGNVLYALGYYEEARSAYLSSLQSAEKLGLASLVPKVYVNLGMSLEAEGMLMNACEYYR